MKENQHIDQWLKQSMMQEQKLPTLSVWDKIEATLDRKKRKKAIAWWSVATVLLLTSIGTIAVLQNYKTIDDSEVVIEKPTIKNSTLEFIEPDNIEESKTNESTKHAENASQSINKSITDATLSENDIKLKTTKKLTKETLESDKSVSEKTEKTITPKIIEIINGNSSIKTEIDIADIKENNLYSTIAFNNRKPQALNTSLDPIIGSPLTLSIVPIGQMNRTDKNDRQFKGDIITFGLNAGLSPSNSNLSIDKVLLNYVHIDYLNIRRNSETPTLNFSYGAYIRKDIGKITLQLGVNYLTQGYRQNYHYLITKIPITNRFNTIPDKNGKYPLDEQTPYLNVRNPKSVDYTANVINTYIDIPLNIGYRIIARKNWSLIPNVGIGLNLLQQSGAENTIDYQRLTLIKYQGLFVQNKRAYTFNTSIMLEKRLYKSLNITLQPYYHQFISSNTSTINEKTQQYGVNLGLNFKWQKK